MTNQKFKILILAAIPHGLRLDAELRFISECIRGAARRDMFDTSIKTAVRPRDIRRAIREEKPQIVHFCGHGKEDGSLLLEDDGGNNKLVSPQGLAALFQQHSDYVKCVVLNACYSEKTAESISQHINYVIGMNKPIGDKAAIEFAEGFYDGLGYEQEDNQDVFQKAFDEGLVAIALEDFSQKSIPVLKSYGIKSSSNGIVIKKSEDIAIKKLEDIPAIGSEASEVGADYTSLSSMLSKGDFKAANEETTRIMLWVARREKEGHFDKQDIEKFPCLDLHTIDQLWLASSEGKFGFSVQKQVWIECGGKLEQYDPKTMDKFYEHIEWKRVKEPEICQGNLCWDLRAPKGHLPAKYHWKLGDIAGLLTEITINDMYYKQGYNSMLSPVLKVKGLLRSFLYTKDELKEMNSVTEDEKDEVLDKINELQGKIWITLMQRLMDCNINTF
ncbi:MAG: GUN4 domain-containing protein [Cyanobacteria bacterium P01_G01_bin.49]